MPSTDAPASRSIRIIRIIAMLNQKGGVGKTTSAANIGAALASSGKRVCLIDLDPQGHLTLHLGIDADAVERTVYDLLIDPDCRAEDVVLEGVRPNLDAILAEVDLAGAETELSDAGDRQDILRRKFDAIAHRYDVVLIDCPPSLGLLTLNALAMANELFVPMQAHFLALQGVGRLLETVGLVCRSVNPALRVTGILLCMHEGQTTLAREVVADLDAFFEADRDKDVPWSDCRVLRPPIRRNIKLAEAPSFGQTIFDYAPWCPGALDYARLVERLIARWREEDRPEGVAASIAPTGTPTAPRSIAPPKPVEPAACDDDGAESVAAPPVATPAATPVATTAAPPVAAPVATPVATSAPSPSATPAAPPPAPAPVSKAPPSISATVEPKPAAAETVQPGGVEQPHNA